jgi:hypothetical protein
MNIYHRIYSNIISRNVNQKELWENKENGLHRHHIVPKHMGGEDTEDNYTYLTVREHQIAHYLLWKIHRKVNDLRSMHMIGARLTPYQRHLTGKWCVENKIGFFSDEYQNSDVAKKSRLKGVRKQIENKIGIHDPANFKEYAAIGGAAGSKSQIENKIGIHDPASFKKNAILGGKAIKGMICVTNGTHRTRIRPEKLNEYLSNGYRKGFTLFSSNES